LWGTHGDSIKSQTGVKSKQEFLNSPQKQEAFMDFWIEKELKPGISRLRKHNPTKASTMSDDELMALIHFQGLGNAKKYLDTGKMVGADRNASVEEYLRIFKEGRS